ncbi:MAG TPA: VanZ family protein [Rhodopila sp.]|nr:VanZ family protein [Rhodopila sp.]
MEPEPHASSGKPRYAWICLGYATLMLYASTVVGPVGFHLVFRDPAEAFRTFLATRFVATGSDQQADWMGNLLMLAPFGFLVAGALWPRRASLRPLAVGGAMLLCGVAILAIKYLQLFFPPRTVTLNYILAQTLGAAIGSCGFVVWRLLIARSLGRRNAAVTLVLLLRLYAASLLLFLLIPLDFALNPADLLAQLQRLPDALSMWPGGLRPLPVRALVVVASMAAFMPVGALLVLVRTGVYRVRRGLLAVAAQGLAITAGIFGLSALVMGANPVMGSILYRTAGILAGAALLRWLVRQDLARLRRRLRGLVPWLVPLYLLALLLANRLVSLHWLAPSAAVAQAYKLGFLPLFDYYIVTKAQAAKNIAGHAVMYMPVGVGLWLRDPGRRSLWRGFSLAALLSFAVELARYSRPGLEGDVNAVVLAGLAATATTGLMPAVWSMLVTLARQSAPAPARMWDKRGVVGGGAGKRLGEIEHY